MSQKPNVPGQVPDTERLFDEIAGKLNELSTRGGPESPADRVERLQGQLRKSQDEWKSAQNMMQERMANFEHFSTSQNDLSQEIRRLSDLLEQERQNNSKTSADLAKALELNLKLQFDIEEVRTKAGQLVAEERKHNQFLVEKNRGLGTEIELSHAMNQEVRLELGKAREKFLNDQNQWSEDKTALDQTIQARKEELEMSQLKIDETEIALRRKESEFQKKSEECVTHMEEIHGLNEALKAFEEHAHSQNEAMKQLTSTAEKKLIEMKLALDKKIIESNDYYSHLQQALTQVQILRQENSALKEYIQKLTNLHQVSNGQLNMQSQQQAQMQAQPQAQVQAQVHNQNAHQTAMPSSMAPSKPAPPSSGTPLSAATMPPKPPPPQAVGAATPPPYPPKAVTAH